MLDKNIQSMTKFKQIIGRGTRINEDFGKLYFTIMDFKRATELFADKDFDGEPAIIYEPKPGESVVPPDDLSGEETQSEGDNFGDDDDPQAQELGSDTGAGEGGILIDPQPGGSKRKKYVVADVAVQLVCHVAFDQPPLTRRERANNVKKRNYFAKYGEQARAVLEALLDKYADEGIGTIETFNVLNVQPLTKFGTPIEIVRLFGGKDQYEIALRDLESALYAQAQ